MAIEKWDGEGRERPETIDPSTAKLIEADVRASYQRGKQAAGLSFEGTQEVGQAMQMLDAGVGTRAQGEETSVGSGVIPPG